MQAVYYSVPRLSKNWYLLMVFVEYIMWCMRCHQIVFVEYIMRCMRCHQIVPLDPTDANTHTTHMCTHTGEGEGAASC